MNSVERQFKKDFDNSKKVKLTFNVAQLRCNPKPIKPVKQRREQVDRPQRRFNFAPLIVVSVVTTVIAIPVLIGIIASLEIHDSFKAYNKRYSVNEIRIAESNTFKKLNSVSYPNGDKPTKSEITELEIRTYNNFSNRTYHSLIDTSKQDNMSYSVVGLYSTMNELTKATSNSELNMKFNTLLGLNESKRISFYKKIMEANSFAREESTIQLKNAAFFNNEYNFSQDYVNYLTRVYCEAYQIDFKKESDKIVEWASQAVNSNGYIDKNFLDLDGETQLYLLSTLYFKNAWNEKYLSEDNTRDYFYLSGDNKIKTTFMKHSYQMEAYYDYGSYISFSDTYFNGYASVTYIVPKKVEDNIFELTKTANIFEEKEANKVEAEKYDPFIVNLTTPKFTTSSVIDFKKCLENLGFEKMFDKHYDSFKNAFDAEGLEFDHAYLQNLKQKNEVEFNEDGSTVKSVTIAPIGMFGAVHVSQGKTLEIQLNQPFIYIIRDYNDIPIFVGHFDNPKA